MGSHGLVLHKKIVICSFIYSTVTVLVVVVEGGGVLCIFAWLKRHLFTQIHKNE